MESKDLLQGLFLSRPQSDEKGELEDDLWKHLRATASELIEKEDYLNAGRVVQSIQRFLATVRRV